MQPLVKPLEIILATRNPSKTLEIQHVFADSPIIVRSMENAGIIGEAFEPEDGNFESNAFLKAHFVQEQVPGAWVMADDSGICIDAHDGAPGVNTAYWAGRDATQEELTKFIVEKMRGVEDRSATFHTYVALLTPEGEEQVFHGEMPGSLLHEPRGISLPKMPYSALFVPEGDMRTWAEMSSAELSARSHRGIAFRKVREFLESVLERHS
jgi:XTP/dITP diphosphohydrolase